MEIKKNKQGGVRKGAGRPPKDPTVVYQFNLDKELRDIVRGLHPTKEINDKLRALFVELSCV